MQKELHDALRAALGRDGSLIELLLTFVSSPTETASNAPTHLPNASGIITIAWRQVLLEPNTYIDPPDPPEDATFDTVLIRFDSSAHTFDEVA